MAVFQKILAGTCELTTSAFTPVTTMPIFTGDDNGAVISVSFTEDGSAYTIPLDVDVKAYLFYDAKNAMTEAYPMTVDGDTASLDVPDAFTAVSGNPQCIIMMIDGDANVTKVCAFSFPVKRTTSDTIIYLAPPSPDTIVYIGRAPYVCELGTWCVWDNDTRQYVDSGISAAGNYTVFIKWSAINPAQDSDMSDTPNAWMGVYTGQLVTAPTAYTSYQWYNIKGETGATGAAGDNGTSAYVHIRWGTSLTPETLLTSPDTYIGITSSSSPTAPADYTGYSWYLYKGETGAAGTNGSDGTSAYVHIRWGTSLTPATLLTVPDEYIGIASTSSATAPADYTGYAWYKYKGEPGETVTVVDSLTSDSTTSALSAAQGKALQGSKTNLTVASAAYSAESTYALGAYCTYNGLLYECTTAIETPESWTAGHWTERTIGEVLAELNTAKVGKSLYDAHTILYATTDNVPAALTVAEQTVVGRLAGGNIGGIALGIADNNVVQIDHDAVADDDFARFTANGLEGRSADEVLTDISAQAKQTITVNANESPELGTLANNTEYRCTDTTITTAPTMTFAAIASTAVEFACVVIYKASGATAPVVTNNSGYTLKYRGDDVASGTFTPVSGTTYRMSFLFDGIYLNCYIVGVV